MKHFLILAAAIGFSLSASAASKADQQKICDSLQDKLDEDCAHLMCDDLIADGTFKNMSECTSGDDYAEAAQATCEELPSLEDLVKEYNKKHPGAKLQCE